MSNARLALKHIGVRHIERMFSQVDLPASNREELQRVLCNMYVGAEMAAIGKKNVDAGKKYLQNAFDIPTDIGTHDIVTIKPFDVTAKITKPRRAFDLDMFIDLLVNQYDLVKSDLTELAGKCNKYSKPPTTLSVELIEEDD